jgi:nucleotide-binding universal stress UspA family protein
MMKMGDEIAVNRVDCAFASFRKEYRMFHRIVVPLDGSALAERAIDQATDLARMAGVPVHLVRVVDLGRIAGGGAIVWGLTPWALQRALEEEQRGARDYLERTSRGLADKGVKASVEVLHGNTPDEIVAATTADDLVVMSTHGRDGLHRWFLGSVAESVARHAPGPVMLVRSIPAEIDDVLQPSEAAPDFVDAAILVS